MGLVYLRCAMGSALAAAWRLPRERRRHIHKRRASHALNGMHVPFGSVITGRVRFCSASMGHLSHCQNATPVQRCDPVLCSR